MRRMLIVVLLTALSIPLAAHTKIETICGHVGVQSGKDISMTTDEGKKLMVLSDDSTSEERLLKVWFAGAPLMISRKRLAHLSIPAVFSGSAAQRSYILVNGVRSE